MRFTVSILALLAGLSVVHAETVAPPAVSAETFSTWRADFRDRVLQQGLAAAAVDVLLDQTTYLPEVIRQDHTQPEAHQSLADYAREELTPNVLADGRAAYTRNRAVFDTVAERYGVDAWSILGIWANESRYGKLVRPFPIASSLATLAFDHRRRVYFEGELTAFIRMQQMGVPGLPTMTGSWAGALGQPQFEPSDYLDYAVDFDGDGRKDIWTTDADVIGSIANFLKRHGWRKGVPWGSEVQAPADLIVTQNLLRPTPTSCRAADRLSQRLTVKAWRRLGVTGIPANLDGALEASLLSFALAQGRQFLVTGNFETILTYNCSLHYALTAGFVSDLVLHGK